MSVSEAGGRLLCPLIDNLASPDELRAQPSHGGAAAAALALSTLVTHYFTTATWLKVCVRAATAAL